MSGLHMLRPFAGILTSRLRALVPPFDAIKNMQGETWKKPSVPTAERGWERWDKNEQDALVREFAARLRLEEIAKRHRRSVAAIAARLKKLGFEVNDEG